MSKNREPVQTPGFWSWNLFGYPPPGLKIRDQIAMTVEPPEFGISGETFLGRPRPSMPGVEQYRWYCELDARRRYMMADAMMKEREQP